MTTIETIKEILSENLNINPEEITEDATFESLKVDSLDMLELVCDLEDRIGIDFGEPEGLATLGELVAYVDSL